MNFLALPSKTGQVSKQHVFVKGSAGVSDETDDRTPWVWGQMFRCLWQQIQPLGAPIAQTGAPTGVGLGCGGAHQPGCPRGPGSRRWRHLHSSGPTTQGAGVGFAIAPSLDLSLKWRMWFLEPTVRHVLSSPLIPTCTPAAANIGPHEWFPATLEKKSQKVENGGWGHAFQPADWLSNRGFFRVYTSVRSSLQSMF